VFAEYKPSLCRKPETEFFEIAVRRFGVSRVAAIENEFLVMAKAVGGVVG
jgi:hypothetical protein